MNLTGRWIGQTQGKEGPLHYWLIVQHGNSIDLYTRWDFEPHLAIYAKWLPLQGNSFFIETCYGETEASVTHPTRFLVPKWVCERDGDYLIPTYDVVFNRLDKGFHQIRYRILIGLLTSLKTVGHLFGLHKIFDDPMILLK